MSAPMFAPAVKEQLKARVALDGPTGSGKTWTALSMATVLAEGGKIALIDTERQSSKLYANRFAFDVAIFEPPYEVPKLLESLRAAEAAGYAVIVIDSLSHFWEGEGGVLDEVDAAAARSGGGNTFAGWKHGTPLQRNMVDTILGLDAHVIVTMRSKMEYVLEENEKGKKVPRKVGMAPVQRAGVEYEFTLVGDLDLEHRITITKSRCDPLADRVIQPDREAEAAAEFLAWLNDGTPPPPRADAGDVVTFLALVKSQPDDVRSAMNHWWGKERGFVSEKLTGAELDEARGYLADLLIEHGENGRAGGASSGEPDDSHGGSGSENGSAGDDRTTSDAVEASVGTAVAASPDANGEEGGHLPGPTSSSDAKPSCSLCGSTRAALVPYPEGETGYRCEIGSACETRRAEKVGAG